MYMYIYIHTHISEFGGTPTFHNCHIKLHYSFGYKLVSPKDSVTLGTKTFLILAVAPGSRTLSGLQGGHSFWLFQVFDIF